MTHFAIVCWDSPGATDARVMARDAHFRHIEATIGQIAIAGPLKDANGKYSGSLLIVTAENPEGARAMLEADPYFVAGVWDRTEISAFVPAAGDWIGGTIW